MHIRVGYELQYEFPQPTPIIANLNLHYSRVSDIVQPDLMRTTPPVRLTAYRDEFGNWCTRLVAPPGLFSITADGIVADLAATRLIPEKSVAPSLLSNSLFANGVGWGSKWCSHGSLPRE